MDLLQVVHLKLVASGMFGDRGPVRLLPCRSQNLHGLEWELDEGQVHVLRPSCFPRTEGAVASDVEVEGRDFGR